MCSTEQLIADCKQVTDILNGVRSFDMWKSQSTEDKDRKRLRKIYEKDELKRVKACSNMANAITTTEKAVRRALACVNEAPEDADLDTIAKMTRTFLRRAVMLHVGELDPRDIVKLRTSGAIFP